MYRVFLGAPPAADLHNDPNLYQWQTISSSPSPRPSVTALPLSPSSIPQQSSHQAKDSLTANATQPSVLFPVATLEAASQRISLIYKNIIFAENQDEEHIESFRETGNQTTLYTWPPTPVAESEPEDGPSKSQSEVIDMVLETQDTDNNISKDEDTQSFSYAADNNRHSYSTSADVSSLSVLPPRFNFALNSITSLNSLTKSLGPPNNNNNSSNNTSSRKINVLMAVLEVDGPNTIRIKKGVEAGKEVSLLSLVLGDEQGAICKLTAWRQVAETWGGSTEAVGVKRGDVLFIENVLAAWDSSSANTSPTLSASPYLNSTAEICYRTMPYTHEDGRFRPDLRLESDDRARRVAAVVRWFEGMAGLGAG